MCVRVPIEQPTAAKSAGAQAKLSAQFSEGRIIAAVNVAANMLANNAPYPIFLPEHLVRALVPCVCACMLETDASV